MTDRKTQRFQIVRCYDPEGNPFYVLGEVYLNDAGEIWSALPVPVTFFAPTEGDLISELEEALAEARAFPAFDSRSGAYGNPPADLIDDIRREQLEFLEPPTKSKH